MTEIWEADSVLKPAPLRYLASRAFEIPLIDPPADALQPESTQPPFQDGPIDAGGATSPAPSPRAASSVEVAEPTSTGLEVVSVHATSAGTIPKTTDALNTVPGSGTHAGDETGRHGLIALREPHNDHSASDQSGDSRNAENEESNYTASTQPEVPAALTSSFESPPTPQPRHNRAELPPYDPVLRLSTESYWLYDVAPTDIAADYFVQLRHAVFVFTLRHLLGACVRGERDRSCQVILDIVELIKRCGAAATGGGAAIAAGPATGSRRLAAGASSSSSSSCITSERRKAPSGGGWVGWGKAWLASWKRNGWLQAVPVEQDAELGVKRVAAAVLQWGCCRPRGWARWAGIAAVWVAAGRMPSAFPEGSGAKPTCRSAHVPVLASRVTSVAPRVVFLDGAGSGDGSGPTQVTPRRADGVVCRVQPLQPAGGSAAAPAVLHVTASACCGGCSRVRSPRAYPASNRDGTLACSGAADVPSVEVQLRHGRSFVRSCTLSGEGTRAPSAWPPAKACRRALCRQHWTLRQDLQLAEDCWMGLAESAGAMRQLGPADGWLGPGLLLLEPRQPDASRASATAQRPVPVVVLDDPLVAEELQAALTEKQMAACGAANRLDDLLVDLGVYLQHVAELRSVAAPLLAHAQAGVLRPGRMPRCSCAGTSSACCSVGGGGRGKVGGRLTPSSASGPATTDSSSNGVFATSDRAAAPSSTPCLACALQQLRHTLEQYFSAYSIQCLGEALLRYATAAGWTRTASYISSCMVDMQRMDLLVAALCGECWDEELGGWVYGSQTAQRPAASSSASPWASASPAPCFRRIKRLISICFGRPGACTSFTAPHRALLYIGIRRLLAILSGVGVLRSAAVLLATWAMQKLRTPLAGALGWLATQRGVADHGWLEGLPALVLGSLVAAFATVVLISWCEAVFRGRECHGASPARAPERAPRRRGCGWAVLW